LYGEIVEYAAGPQPATPLCDADERDSQMDDASPSDESYLAELEEIVGEAVESPNYSGSSEDDVVMSPVTAHEASTSFVPVGRYVLAGG
jgi:hypothetical protein